MSTAAPPTTKQHRPDKSVNGSRFRRPSLKGYRRIFSRFGSVDAGFRDPSGNGWKMIGERRAPA